VPDLRESAVSGAEPPGPGAPSPGPERPAPRILRLTLEYDGTGFEGWQSQGAGRRTVQDVLEAGLEQVTGQCCPVAGAGRTDAGVHAEGQVASCSPATALSPVELRRALNAVLPLDLAVREVAFAPEGFHARRSARRKLYRYALWNGSVRSPLREHTHWGVRAPLDVAAMEAAAAPLVGTHDFAAFQSSGGGTRTSVRTLERLEVEGVPGGEIRVWAAGDGFLRHMVRALVGTLVEVGRGRRAAGDLPAVLASRYRARAGPTAPARGLTLVRVEYGNPRQTDHLSQGGA